MKRPLELHETEDNDDFFDTDEDSSDAGDIESRYVNLALLSHIAVKLRDKVPRSTHVKGSIPYPHAFTGKDIVSTIQSQIQRELLTTMNISTNDRSIALAIARSLQSQLFFYEVEWSGKVVTDGVEDVFMFLDDQDSTNLPERSELPTGVITFLTKCYVSSCLDETPCYSYACPKRKSVRPYSVRCLQTHCCRHCVGQGYPFWRLCLLLPKRRSAVVAFKVMIGSIYSSLVFRTQTGAVVSVRRFWIICRLLK